MLDGAAPSAGVRTERLCEDGPMRAIVQHVYGDPGVLRLEDVADPAPPGPKEVLVEVRAAAVNHGDLAILSGQPYLLRLAFGLRRQRVAIRGRDLAGVVVAVGDQVTRFRAGDQVYAETPRGSFAERAVVPERLLARKPANLTFERAAAIPVAGVTALQGLRDVGQVRPGQKVLVNGASGGVGTFAGQLATAFGAEVTGVCSTRNLDLVRSLGADHVVDYTREDVTRRGARYDVVLDLVGNHPLADCRRLLTPDGILVLSSGGGGRVVGPLGRYLRAMVLSPFVGQRLRVHAAKPRHEDLDALRELAEAGEITPAVEPSYPLQDTAEAVRRFAEQHARAKLVISV
jgi:NADPH:quinone reductase-like Zn-dependent oxidoreductase